VRKKKLERKRSVQKKQQRIAPLKKEKTKNLTSRSLDQETLAGGGKKSPDLKTEKRKNLKSQTESYRVVVKTGERKGN